MNELLTLFDGLIGFFSVSGLKMIAMWVIGGILIYLAIKKEMEYACIFPQK